LSPVTPGPDHVPPVGEPSSVSGEDPLQYCPAGGRTIWGWLSTTTVVDALVKPHSLPIVRFTACLPGVLNVMFDGLDKEDDAGLPPENVQAYERICCWPVYVTDGVYTALVSQNTGAGARDIVGASRTVITSSQMSVSQAFTAWRRT